VRRHFLIVTYGIRSHINPCRVLVRRLVHRHDEDDSCDPASSHGYGELIASHAADPAFEVTLPGQGRTWPTDLLVVAAWRGKRDQDISEPFFRAVRIIVVPAYSAQVGAPDIPFWIAQTAARTKIFKARPTLQRLLENAKTRSAMYINGFFFCAALVCNLCRRCSKIHLCPLLR
jgi:hypothetical protein